jgi:hypothetical protein
MHTCTLDFGTNTPHGRYYRVFNIETNTVVESYDVTFAETAPYPHDVFECAGDKEMEEGIFVDEELHGFDGDKDDPLRPSTSSPEPVLASTLEAETPYTTTSSIAAVKASWVGGDHLRPVSSLSYLEGTSTSADHM